MQNRLITFLITGLISAALGCAHKKLPPKNSIPHNIPTDVRSEIEGLYGNANERAYAAFSLGEMGRRATPAIPYLIGVLKDNRPLAKVDEEILELLKRNAPKSPARIAAVALIKIGRPALGPLIALLLDQNKRVRSWAVLALGEIDPDWQKSETASIHVPKFLKELTSEDWSQRAVAAQALGTIKDKRAVAGLTAALEDENPDVRSSAALALEKIKDIQTKVEKPAVGPLIKELKTGSRSAREKAAEALGRTGDTQAVGPLLAALNDKDSYVRSSAALALGEIGDSRAIKPLIAALKEENLRLRWRATWALGKIGKPAIEPLIIVLKDDESIVQDKAEEALVKIGEAAVEALIAALKDNYHDIRYGAVKALTMIKDRRSVGPLILTLKDRSRDIGQVAAEALGRIGDVRAVEPLIAILKDLQMVRYYGWYSNKSRGLRKKQGILKPGDSLEQGPVNIEIIDVADYKLKTIPSKKWRECIKKIYEVDPLCCPKCGGEMKIISFITEHQIIKKILEHLIAFGSKMLPETHPIKIHPPKIMS